MNDKLREALELMVSNFEHGDLNDGEAQALRTAREALAASKQEPQAQAEPEVVAWIGVAPRDGRIHLVVDKPSPTPMRAFNFQPLITLQSHREAMAKAGSLMEMSLATIEAQREAIAKKDAALDACVLPESYAGGTLVSGTDGWTVVRLHFGNAEQAEKWFEAITSTKDTP